MTKCPNPAHGLLHIAPIPCRDCGGWLDRDGTLMDRETTVARYPFMLAQIVNDPAPPDGRVERGVPERLGAFAQGVGQLGGWFVRLAVWLFVLAVIVLVGVALLH